jgi:phage/conjugal plasmid C-4 type zinc finger TraR family protein
MSGYGGNPDMEAEHAMILAENAIALARSMLPVGESEHFCLDCNEPIPEARRVAQKGCKYCIDCQVNHDTPPRIRMLDHILWGATMLTFFKGLAKGIGKLLLVLITYIFAFGMIALLAIGHLFGMRLNVKKNGEIIGYYKFFRFHPLTNRERPV